MHGNSFFTDLVYFIKPKKPLITAHTSHAGARGDTQVVHMYHQIYSENMPTTTRRYAWSPRDYIEYNPENFGIQENIRWKPSTLLITPQDQHRLIVAKWQHSVCHQLHQAWDEGNGFLLKDVAAYLGITPEHLSHLIHGKGSLTIENMAGIHRFLANGRN